MAEESEEMKKAEEAYSGSSITVLEGLEAVRVRPAMYIGSTDIRGLHHLVWEVVDNSVDEALAGFCSHIEISILPGNGIRVTDNGRGIPTDIHPKEHIGTIEVVMTKLHAGGKFDSNSYKVSAGLHGVGVSCVNALSNKLIVTVRRDGKVVKQEFSRGIPCGPQVEVGPSDGTTGTSVEFYPDDSIFTECDNITVIACGTAMHAGLIGKFLIEKTCGVPVTVNMASETKKSVPRLSATRVAFPSSCATWTSTVRPCSTSPSTWCFLTVSTHWKWPCGTTTAIKKTSSAL